MQWRVICTYVFDVHYSLASCEASWAVWRSPSELVWLSGSFVRTVTPKPLCPSPPLSICVASYFERKRISIEELVVMKTMDPPLTGPALMGPPQRWGSMVGTDRLNVPAIDNFSA